MISSKQLRGIVERTERDVEAFMKTPYDLKLRKDYEEKLAIAKALEHSLCLLRTATFCGACVEHWRNEHIRFKNFTPTDEKKYKLILERVK